MLSIRGKSYSKPPARWGLKASWQRNGTAPIFRGKRSAQWLKIKIRRTTECLIIGYTKGKGDRQSSFGALHLARADDDSLRYVGKVGTGFDDRTLSCVISEVKKIKQTKRPVKEKPIDDANSVWIEPRMYCEVEYASITKDGMLREPVFVRLRPDL